MEFSYSAKAVDQPIRCRSSGTWPCSCRACRPHRPCWLPRSMVSPLIVRCPRWRGGCRRAPPAVPTGRCRRRRRCRRSRRRGPEKETSLTTWTPRLSVTSGCRPQARAPRVRRFLVDRSSTLRPTISSASSSMEVFFVSRVATISPRRITETVSVTAMISRSLWVIRRIVLPSSLQDFEDPEEVIGLRRRQHAGRFVQDQDIGAAVERLQDFHPLLQADRKVLDQGVRVDLAGRSPLPAASAPARAHLVRRPATAPPRRRA
jgi:hypothetical protein